MAEPGDKAPLIWQQLTPSGRGAVAVIALAGDLSLLDELLRSVNGVSVASQPVDRLCYGQWQGTGAPAEDVVYVRTAESSAELHCHGGLAAIGRIIRDLSQRGAVSGAARRQTSLQRDLETALIRASTRRSAHHLLNQCRVFPEFIQRLRDLLPEQGLKSIDEALSWSGFGRRLTTPASVVLCGPPNVGKSSLINSLMGFERVVVFDQPGTTRDVVSAQTAFAGWPVELSDTAGLRDARDPLEAAGIELARQRLATADVILAVLDASRPIGSEELGLLAALPEATVLLNKCDLPTATVREFPGRVVIPVSAVTGVGISDLTNHVSRLLVPEEPPRSMAFPVTIAQEVSLRRLRDLIHSGDLSATRRLLEDWLIE